MDKKTLFGYDEEGYMPIIREKSEELLKDLIKQHNVENILEIGAFIGYSAGVMLETQPRAKIISLEVNETNAQNARKNLEKFGDRVQVVCCDAFDYLKTVDEAKFDLIFLDGPKGQYYRYLPYIKKALKKGGILFADDILFHGYVQQEGRIKHKHRALVNNLRKFIEIISHDEDLQTEIFEFEDGVSVSILKNER